MPEKPNLKESEIKYSTIPNNLRGLLIGAILNPAESIRKNHIDTLNKILKNELQRGFEADNQLFIILEGKAFDLGTYCICNKPKTYAGSPRIQHRFYRQNNRFISM